MELVFITAIINVHDGREVACFDISGVYLHVDINENTTMVLKCRLTKLVVQVVSNLYRK